MSGAGWGLLRLLVDLACVGLMVAIPLAILARVFS